MPSILIITDRTDLDEQLHGTFASAEDFLRQSPVKIESREDLINELDKRVAGGIYLTTIQKFTEETGELSRRHDIIVIADEAHRSQYGMDPDVRIDKKSLEAQLVYGYAKYLRDAFPNATFIGFTGTPIDKSDKSTIGVFGEVIDIYDMTQSKLDGATLDIHYENRLNLVVEDILKHYNIRKDVLKGKAMIVAYSRKIAYRMYQLILEKAPELSGKVHLVMTESNYDSEDMRKVIGNKQYKQSLANEFKKEDSDFKIAIVVDMWLTGFDVPSLDTMYIDKIMQEHNFMQAIARVNRVYKDKEAGLIVDYIGLGKYLREALKIFTNRDKQAVPGIEKAKDILMTEIEILESMFHGFDFSNYIKANPKERFELIQDGVEHVLKVRAKKDFLDHVTKMHNAYKICATSLPFEDRVKISFFMAIKAFIVKVERDGMPDVEAFKRKISAMIEEAIIKEDDAVSIMSRKEKSLLSEENIEKLMAMKRRNIAAEILKKLLEDTLKYIEKINLVRASAFSQKLKLLVDKYNQITNADIDSFIGEMINIAKEIEEANKEGAELELTPEEQAFYDALSKPELVKEHYKSDILREMAKQLIMVIRKNKTPDWYKRNDAKANMRALIKRLLKQYKYPPEEIPEATELVIKQAELQMRYEEEDRYYYESENYSLAAESSGMY